MKGNKIVQICAIVQPQHNVVPAFYKQSSSFLCDLSSFAIATMFLYRESSKQKKRCQDHF
jgi:hypothetical protein